MAGKRWIMVLLALLLVFGGIAAISGAAQRDAWMQGYMVGRMSADGDGASALAPYLLQSGGLMPRAGGFGAGFGLLIALGFLALAFGMIRSRGRGHHRRWHEGHREWAEHMRQEAQRWHEQRGQPDEREQRV